MDKVINFLKKYKVHILAGLLIIFFFKGCGKSRTISKLEKIEKSNIEMIDSLESVISVKTAKIDSFPEVLRTEKLNIYLSLDDTISRVDRSPQLMGLHKMIKDSVKALQK